ncbi:MAG: hypothetical protein AAFN40_06040 [Cyanobacteria bacterium J06560_6]
MDSFSQDGSSDSSLQRAATPDESVRSPQNFETALQITIDFALDTFKQQIETQQLYYHGIEHVEGVARRARLIFDTVIPFYQQAGYVPDIPWDRQRDLLQLSAIAHDMLQIFLPQSSVHTSRQRQSGHSEKATIDRLLTFIEQINQSKAQTANATEVALPAFTVADIALLQEAVEATVCQYDPADGSIYQPLLYSQHRGDRALSLVARAVALADLGTLGIEGMTAYQREGCLLLLEENLDILPFCHYESALGESGMNKSVSNKPVSNKPGFDEKFTENLRQRLLKRARFDVSFAKGRLARLDAELEGLPIGAIAALKQHVFTHLTPATIQRLVEIVPTAEESSLSELLSYFRLKT